ncbi:MAG: hypothetical protein ACKV2U_11695 [Bryobacteraceae bacterium]
MDVRILSLFLLLVAGCASAPQNQEAVKQAILDHLGKRGDMLAQSMKIDVVSVNFREKEADAVVSVSPKEGGSGIQMNYSLTMDGGKWTVNPPKANPHGATGTPTGDLPAGHPPAGGAGGGAVHAPSTPKAHP